MNTADLKAYAPKARRDFIAAVTKQAQKYGVTESVIHPVEINGDVCVVNGKPFPASLAPRINKLGERVNSQGFAQTMEQVAYSWFNRLIAIRYMELHDYLGHGRRVLSHPEHASGFQILEECTDLSYGNDGDAGQLPHLTHEKVVELKLDGTKDEELFRELLLAQCHALHTAMPFLFEPLDDETELLLPENLTKTDSLIHDLITDISEDDWNNIEVIGWLYQFYISEKKDQVIGKVVKSEDIPAATQLFTPNWIVKYMVQNSLGAQWLATYPESPLKAQMEYYITPAEQTDEVNAQLKAITPESLNPEELTLIDPASGSGHILVEAYDLFKAIYLERGYRQRDIAQLILEKNLFGLDIDQRAAQLTGFALMMKGREDDRRLFERGVKLNVTAMVDSTSLDVDTLVHGIELSQFGSTQRLTAEDLTTLKDLFEHATTFGSLIQVPQTLAEKLPALKQLSETNSQDMFVKEVLEHLAPLVKQAEILAAQYDAVVANPPYMGSGGMNKILKKFANIHYPNGKVDLFACFIERGWSITKESGRSATITMDSWMFLSSFTNLRDSLLCNHEIDSLVHVGWNCFPEVHTYHRGVAFITTQDGIVRKGNFQNLSDVLATVDKKRLFSERLSRKEMSYQKLSSEFRDIPGSPLAYWISETVRKAFSTYPSLGTFSTPSNGVQTGDNEQFLRYWYEINTKKMSIKWFPYNKGGKFRKWYGNLEYVINWESNGLLIKSQKNSCSRGEEYYGTTGVTWSDVTSGRLSARYMPEGCIFDASGPTAFFEDTRFLFATLLLLNAPEVNKWSKLLNPTIHFQTGDFRKLVLAPDLSCDEVVSLTESLIIISKEDWNAYERSWDFQFLPILLVSSKLNSTLKAGYSSWINQNRDTITEMKRLEEENNRLFIDAYGLADELTPDVLIEQITLTVNPAYRYGVKGTEEERNIRFREDTMAELVSYAIGCMMGRYSLDEPGLIYANSGNVGFDASRYTKFPADDDGIIPLTDKEWFSDDAANRLVEFISVAWDASHVEENLNFLAANLSPKKGEDSRDTIRRYLCDKFYKDHMQTYKKRPIYWLFSSGKQKAFQCLVYLHRYNESTLARMRTEYVIPLTAKLSSHIEKLENDKGASGSAAEIKKLEKEIKNLQKQQTELTEFDEKLKHYADMRIPLDLDDGVKVNYGKFGDLLSDVKAIHGKNV